MKIVKIAYIVAFLIAAGTLLAALAGPIVAAPFALVPLIGGIGILRKRVWSAYGLATFYGAPIALVPLLLARSQNPSAEFPRLVVPLIASLAFVALFVCAGRSLAAQGSERGRPAAWILLTAAVLVPFLFFQAFSIPTASMENTIRTGDYILVRRLPKPNFHRGDIVAFVYPVDRRETYVKRIVGMAGDRIRISGKQFYRNGSQVAEPYAIHQTDFTDSYRDNFPGEPEVPLSASAKEMLANHVVNGEVVVPPGKYFVLGDNRDLSFDSRYWGFVDSADLIGKPVLIYESQHRWDRIFKVL